jgi:hypothetical protein
MHIRAAEHLVQLARENGVASSQIRPNSEGLLSLVNGLLSLPATHLGLAFEPLLPALAWCADGNDQLGDECRAGPNSRHSHSSSSFLEPDFRSVPCGELRGLTGRTQNLNCSRSPYRLKADAGAYVQGRPAFQAATASDLLVDRNGAPGHHGWIMRPASCTATIAFIGSWPVQAFACTLCHSQQAASIRARLLQSDLLLNLCAVVLPLALLAWIIALIASGSTGGSRAR